MGVKEGCVTKVGKAERAKGSVAVSRACCRGPAIAPNEPVKLEAQKTGKVCAGGMEEPAEGETDCSPGRALEGRFA